MPRLRCIKIRGHEYPTLMDAWLAETPDGVSYSTVHKRLSDGWSHHRALLSPLSAPMVEQLELDLCRHSYLTPTSSSQ